MSVHRVARSFPAALLLLAPLMLPAQSLERLGDAGSVAVSSIASVPLGPMRFATAVRSAGALRVIVWGLDGAGQVTELSATTGGDTDRIAAAQTGRDRLVTAVRTQDGSLRLISWHVDAAGAIARKAQADAGRIEEVAITAVNRTTVVAAVRDADSELKLISWRVDSVSGTITRLADIGFGKVTKPAIVALAPGRLVVAGRGASGRIVLRALDVDASGSFTARTNIVGREVGEFSLATVSVERVVTAARRTSDGALLVSTWNVTPAGTLTLRSELTGGAASSIAVTSRGAAHAISALRQSDGTMRLIAFDAVGALVRLGSIDAGTATDIGAITLGSDRIVTPLRAADGTLKVIAWRDRAVTLLRGAWGPQVRMMRAPTLGAVADVVEVNPLGGLPMGTGGTAPTGTRPGGLRPGDMGWTTTDDLGEASVIGLSPALVGTAIRTGVNSAGWDPMLAVGHQFIIVTQDHEIAFFDRQGQRLAQVGSTPVQLSATDFFSTFIAQDNGDGTPNEHNINRHIGTGPWFAECALATAPQPCLVEFYDTRAVYDRSSRRFVIVSAARGSSMTFASGTGTKDTDPAVRRYFAVAVSKTEDPRDGFWQYMTTESNYADWPRVVAQHGVIVMSHNSYQTQEAREGPTPTAYVFATDSMKAGRARATSWKVYSRETGGNIVPVANYGSITGNWSSLSRRGGDTLHLYSFRTLATLSQANGLVHDSVTMGAALPDKRNVFDVRRGNSLYLAGHLKVTDAVANTRPARYSVRMVRVPLTLGSTGRPVPNTVAANGFLDTYFGKRAPSDANTDLVSYEVPSVAVTSAGDMVFVYGRTPVQVAGSLFPEARYSVYYADSRGLRRSRVLQAGEWLPTAPSDDAATTATVVPFVNGPSKLDHTAATVDPVDDQTVWMAAAFADSTLRGNWDTTCGKTTTSACRRWRSMVIGRVKP
ncbi:MAG: hypothetical protein V4813_18305 [Gemmatimonadota bacterium]